MTEPYHVRFSLSKKSCEGISNQTLLIVIISYVVVAQVDPIKHEIALPNIINKLPLTKCQYFYELLQQMPFNPETDWAIDQTKSGR